jgi:FkbM family methyltransferase
MMYYGQYNEDNYIRRTCEGAGVELTPYIVDLGCGDGLHNSNSLYWIESRGWDALLCDANNDVLDLARERHEANGGVSIRHAILDSQEYPATLSESPFGWSTNVATRDDNSEISTVRIKDILDSDRDIGILSIDLEGCDTRVLKDMFESTGIRPEVIIIEGNGESERADQRGFIISGGYIWLTRLDVNQIFMRVDKFNSGGFNV